MSFICVIGPCWRNLNTLLDTIQQNRIMLSNIKKFYISTNDEIVERYFIDLNDPSIICKKFAENEGHQTSCFNSIIAGMKMIIDNETDNEDDIVIYSHEDVYIKDITLFNNSVNKFQRGCDVVCRVYTGTKLGEQYDYYMNDAFLIKKNKVKEIFRNTAMKQIEIGNFCEKEFTTIIQKYKIFAIPYCYHSTHKDSELGFYHILNYNIGNIPFWDKKNIQEILDL
jgi:hypothetical protein